MNAIQNPPMKVSSTLNDETVNTDTLNEAFEYRAVHVAAVLGLLIGVLSSVISFTAGAGIESTLLLAPIPLLGLFVSLYALRAINAAPEVYAGDRLAAAGALLSGMFMLYGVGYGSYVHATEVPDGYTRTSFTSMKPSPDDVVNRKLIPTEVEQLIRDGEKVFIKGYIRPDSTPYKQNISKFLLVRDNQECCFGDMNKVKYFDQVQVLLASGLTTDFSRGLFRVGGVMKIQPGNPQLGTPLTYTLDADYVKP